MSLEAHRVVRPSYSFLLEAESTQGHRLAGRIRSTEKFSYLIGNQTRDLPACSIVLQPTTLSHAPIKERITQMETRCRRKGDKGGPLKGSISALTGRVCSV
jgi:hypothetical protein